MKYILVILILLSFNTTQANVKCRRVCILGIAKNEKGGAILRNKQGIYVLDNVDIWDSLYVDQRVCVNGYIEYVNHANDTDSLMVQDYPKYHVIRNAKWKLCVNVR